MPGVLDGVPGVLDGVLDGVPGVLHGAHGMLAGVPGVSNGVLIGVPGLLDDVPGVLHCMSYCLGAARGCTPKSCTLCPQRCRIDSCWGTEIHSSASADAV